MVFLNQHYQNTAKEIIIVTLCHVMQKLYSLLHTFNMHTETFLYDRKQTSTGQTTNSVHYNYCTMLMDSWCNNKHSSLSLFRPSALKLNGHLLLDVTRLKIDNIDLVTLIQLH